MLRCPVYFQHLITAAGRSPFQQQACSRFLDSMQMEQLWTTGKQVARVSKLHTDPGPPSSSSDDDAGFGSQLASTSGDEQPQSPVEELRQVMLHPISKGRQYNGQLSPYMLNMHGQLFLDPNMALTSTMRALHVIKQVLRQDGMIYIVNSNRECRPLMKEAARCCLNPNVWFYYDKWTPGLLTNYRATKGLFRPHHQPNRQLFQDRKQPMINVHCPLPPIEFIKIPKVPHRIKLQLNSLRHFDNEDGRAAAQLLPELLQLERQMVEVPLANTVPGPIGRIRLLVVLDPSCSSKALQEAYQVNVLTISTVNHNTDLSTVTYPIYARDFHPAFQRFFLSWLLKVANYDPDLGVRIEKMVDRQEHLRTDPKLMRSAGLGDQE